MQTPICNVKIVKNESQAEKERDTHTHTQLKTSTTIDNDQKLFKIIQNY